MEVANDPTVASTPETALSRATGFATVFTRSVGLSDRSDDPCTRTSGSGFRAWIAPLESETKGERNVWRRLVPWRVGAMAMASWQA